MRTVHHIQRKILNQLLYTRTLGYAQMRPSGVESNHFAYHLEQLMIAGLVSKSGRDYSLTVDGLALADRASHENMTVRVQPHIVTSINVTSDTGKTLLYEHRFQPYIGLFGLPQGRTHYEEHVAEAASRELFEKTGLSQVPLRHRGIVYVHATNNHGADISKILVHVFSGTVIGTPALAEPTSNGTCSWANTKRLAADKCMPGFKNIQKLLASGGGFFFDEIETKMK